MKTLGVERGARTYGIKGEDFVKNLVQGLQPESETDVMSEADISRINALKGLAGDTGGDLARKAYAQYGDRKVQALDPAVSAKQDVIKRSLSEKEKEYNDKMTAARVAEQEAGSQFGRSGGANLVFSPGSQDKYAWLSNKLASGYRYEDLSGPDRALVDAFREHGKYTAAKAQQADLEQLYGGSF